MINCRCIVLHGITSLPFFSVISDLLSHLLKRKLGQMSVECREWYFVPAVISVMYIFPHHAYTSYLLHFSFSYFEVSAVSGKNVMEAFAKLFELAAEMHIGLPPT